MFPSFNSQPETEQSKRRFANKTCSVFEYGLFRDKGRKSRMPRRLSEKTRTTDRRQSFLIFVPKTEVRERLKVKNARIRREFAIAERKTV
jgi:hypothetical protein